MANPNCPNFGDDNIKNAFNDIIERLGGKRMEEKDFKTNQGIYYMSLSPKEQTAIDKAYAHWDTSAGNYGKINSLLDAQSKAKTIVPAGVVKVLGESGTPKSVIKEAVDYLHGIVNPDIKTIGEAHYAMFKEDQAKRQSIGMIESYASLPRYKAKIFPEWQKAFDIMGTVRPETRNKMRFELETTAEPFIRKLTNKESIGRVEKVLVEGDDTLGGTLKNLRNKAKEAEKAGKKAQAEYYQKAADDLQTLNRYSDEQLKKGITLKSGEVVKLNDQEIEAYASARAALDQTHTKLLTLLTENELKRYKDSSWFRVLERSFAIRPEDKDVKSIAGALKGAGQTAETKVGVDVAKAFRNLSEGVQGLKPEDKADINKTFSNLYKTMAADLDVLKKAISDATGETDDAQITKGTKEMLAAYLRSSPGMKKISEMRKNIGRVVAYFPRVRERGEKKLRLIEDKVKENKDGTKETVEQEHWMNTYTSEREYVKAVKSVLDNPQYSENGKLKPGLRFAKPESAVNTPEFAYSGVTDMNLMKVFSDAMERAKNGEKNDMSADNWDDLKQPLFEAMTEVLQSRGWGSRQIRRQAETVKGYKETGLQNVLRDYISGFSGMVSKQTAAKDYLEFMSDKGSIDPKLYDDLAQYGKDNLRNEDKRDKLVGHAKTAAYLYYLGGIMRQPIVNLTQNFTMGAPMLDKWMRENKVKGSASLALVKAMKDITKDKFNGGKGDSFKNEPLIQKMLQELHIEGATQDQYTNEVLGHLEGRMGAAFSKITRFITLPMAETETLNRQAASVAMFRMAYPEMIRKGLSPEQAYADAKQVAKEYTLDAHNYYGKANYPRLISGGETTQILGKGAYVFRSFTHNYAMWMLQQADWKARVMSLGYIAAFGGMASLPFVKDLMDEIEARTGYNIKKKVHDSLKGVGGETLAQLGMYGLPTVFGGNISGSLSIGAPGLGQGTPSDTVFGVWGGLAQKVKNASQSASVGDYSRATEDIAPEALRSALAAYRLATAPATTRTGKPLFDKNGKPLQLGPVEAGIRALGIQPAEFAQQSSEARSVQVIEKHFANVHQSIIDKFQVARNKKDPSAMKDLIQNVKKFNQDIKDKDVVGLIKPMKLSQATKPIVPSKKQRAEQRYMQRSE